MNSNNIPETVPAALVLNGTAVFAIICRESELPVETAIQHVPTIGRLQDMSPKEAIALTAGFLAAIPKEGREALLKSVEVAEMEVKKALEE